EDAHALESDEFVVPGGGAAPAGRARALQRDRGGGNRRGAQPGKERRDEPRCALRLRPARQRRVASSDRVRTRSSRRRSPRLRTCTCPAGCSSCRSSSRPVVEISGAMVSFPLPLKVWPIGDGATATVTVEVRGLTLRAQRNAQKTRKGGCRRPLA